MANVVASTVCLQESVTRMVLSVCHPTTVLFQSSIPKPFARHHLNNCPLSFPVVCSVPPLTRSISLKILLRESTHTHMFAICHKGLLKGMLRHGGTTFVGYNTLVAVAVVTSVMFQYYSWHGEGRVVLPTRAVPFPAHKIMTVQLNGSIYIRDDNYTCCCCRWR